MKKAKERDFAFRSELSSHTLSVELLEAVAKDTLNQLRTKLETDGFKSTGYIVHLSISVTGVKEIK